METFFPPIDIGKVVRIPCSLNTCPSNAFNTVGDEMRVGEPRVCQHNKDIIHIVVPSSRNV